MLVPVGVFSEMVVIKRPVHVIGASAAVQPLERPFSAALRGLPLLIYVRQNTILLGGCSISNCNGSSISQLSCHAKFGQSALALSDGASAEIEWCLVDGIHARGPQTLLLATHCAINASVSSLNVSELVLNQLKQVVLSQQSSFAMAECSIQSDTDGLVLGHSKALLDQCSINVQSGCGVIVAEQGKIINHPALFNCMRVN